MRTYSLSDELAEEMDELAEEMYELAEEMLSASKSLANRGPDLSARVIWLEASVSRRLRPGGGGGGGPGRLVFSLFWAISWFLTR